METGKTLQGSSRLAFDTAYGITGVVANMHRNIASLPLPLGQLPAGDTPGIAGLIYRAVQGAIRGTGNTLDWALNYLAPELDKVLPPGPNREAIIAALNGVCGDHLQTSGNPLAIPMQLRVRPFAETIADNIAEGTADGTAEASQANTRTYTGKLLIAVHGLSMSLHAWNTEDGNHVEAVAEAGGFTPVYLTYNSGLHVSTNGREFCDQLTDLLSHWPVAIESISFIGFSMGGLLTRSALHIAQHEGLAWLDLVDKAVYVGTPHQGAVLERGGYWVQKGLTLSPYSAPLAALSRIRSNGIIDLRHGNVQDADWQSHDAHEEPGDFRQSTPLPEGITHYAIAVTLSKPKHSQNSAGTRGHQADEVNRVGDQVGEHVGDQVGEHVGDQVDEPDGLSALTGKLRGDGLVHPTSALGRHAVPKHELQFVASNTRLLFGVGHLRMLQDPRVTEQLKAWLL